MAAKQPKVEPVKKPYLKGSFCGKDAWKTVPKRFAGMLMICFVYAIASMIMNFDSLAMRIVVSVMIVAAALYYAFAKGMEQGTGDVGYGEMMYARQQEGKTIDKLDSDRCYHPLKGFFEALCAGGAGVRRDDQAHHLFTGHAALLDAGNAFAG